MSKEERNAYMKNWYKTKKGFISSQYSRMMDRTRTKGYLGIISREEYYTFLKTNEQFNILFNAWEIVANKHLVATP